MRSCVVLALMGLLLAVNTACQGPDVLAEAQRLSIRADGGPANTARGSGAYAPPLAVVPETPAEPVMPVEALSPVQPAPPVASLGTPAPLSQGFASRDPFCCDPCDIGTWGEPPCRDIYIDGSLSMLPNIGVGIGAGKVFWRQSNNLWAFEVQGTYQFLDDEDISSDGNPKAGDWYQLRAGIKNTLAPSSRRHFTGRYGVVWFQANGEPNIIGQPGDYVGIYAGAGFETDLTPHLTVGPELSVMVVSETDRFHIVRPVPQLNWHVTYWLGRGGNGCATRAPIGELYMGATALLSPGFGAGLEGGQVFLRNSTATLSFELLAGAESPSGDLAFNESSGKWAQIRGGVKASFQPCCRGHWTARGGATWLRSTADNDFLNAKGDYVGVYLGAGYEWDLGKRFTTGPEITALIVSEEQKFDLEVVPQLNWHFIFKL